MPQRPKHTISTFLVRTVSAVVFAALLVPTTTEAVAAPTPAERDTASFDEAQPFRPVRVARKRSSRRKKKGANKPRPIPTDTATPKAPAPANQVQLPPPPPLPRKHKAVAVLPLHGIEVTEEILHSIQVSIVREIEESRGMRAIGPAAVAADLEKVGLSSNCDGETKCLAEAGRYARAHMAVETRIAAIGGTLSISLRLVDTREATEIGRVADSVSEDAEMRATDLHRLSVQLLRPDTYVGSLKITSAEKNADIYLDDKLVGTTPLKKPLTGLKAGPHIMRISKAGFSDMYRFVDVVYKRSSTISVDLTTTTITGAVVEEVSTTGFGGLYIATTETSVQIRIDGEPKGVTPMGGPIAKVAAGVRRISVHREGMETVASEIDITEGRRTDIGLNITDNGFIISVMDVTDMDATLPSPEVITAVSADLNPALGIGTGAGESEMRGLGWRTVGGMIVAGAGGVSLLAASYYGNKVREKNELSIALEKDWKANDCIGQGPPDDLDPDSSDEAESYCASRWAIFNRLEDNGPRAATYHQVALGVGTALAAIGGGMILWDIFAATTSEPEPSAELGALPIPGGGLVTFSARW